MQFKSSKIIYFEFPVRAIFTISRIRRRKQNSREKKSDSNCCAHFSYLRKPTKKKKLLSLRTQTFKTLSFAISCSIFGTHHFSLRRTPLHISSSALNADKINYTQPPGALRMKIEGSEEEVRQETRPAGWLVISIQRLKSREIRK